MIRWAVSRIGARAWDGLLAVLAASLDQLLEFPACWLLGGLVVRRVSGKPLEAADGLLLVGFLLTAGLLVRRIVRSPERPLDGLGRGYKTPPGTTGPTASWAHAPWSALYFWLAYVFWTLEDAESKSTQYGPGPGILIAAAGFAVLRVVFRI